MSNSSKLTGEHLRRRAVVYVRQSTSAQVHEHPESTRRQYELRSLAEEHGFCSVEVIDEDLGRSGSGNEDRPGFQKLAGQVLNGSVGAIVCLEASRLARNGRDWQHLLDVCGLVGAVVIDPQGVYDPRLGNDRLLLGIKGSLAEYELSVLNERMLAARDGKAERGELKFNLAPGYVWDALGRIVIDPDERVSAAMRLIFEKFRELGSARKTALWLRANDVLLPTLEKDGRIGWREARSNKVVRTLRHPIYAGTYVWGRTESRLQVFDGRPRKVHGARKSRDDWRVLLEDRHPGYISKEEYDRNQLLLDENAHRMERSRQSGRGGAALLTGILRCGQCGRRMFVRYRSDASHRYECRGEAHEGGPGCFSAAARRIDEVVRAQILMALTPHAVDAALRAANEETRSREQLQAVVRRDLEHAQYEARLAERRYEAVDPDKRLVARELEARWEDALQRVQDIERRLEDMENEARRDHVVDLAKLLELAGDLSTAWDAPGTTKGTRQRLVHLLLYEAVLSRTNTEFELVLHWHGGRHTRLTMPRRGACPATAEDAGPGAVEIVRKMAGQWPDRTIALTINRQPNRDADAQGWTESRVRALRERLGLPAVEPGAPANSEVVTLSQAADELGISRQAIRRLISEGILNATQAVARGPWAIRKTELEQDRVAEAAKRLRNGSKPLKSHRPTTPTLPGMTRRGA